jgi:hypothetical protein
MRIQEFDFSVNLMQAILWQYNSAERLQSLLEQKDNWYLNNQTEFWQNWYEDVFNLQTANDFGLTVWAIILGLPLTITSVEPVDRDLFGFGAFRFNFTRGNFAPSSSGINLTTVQKRLVLKLRYFQLVTRGAIPEINKFLAFAFKDFGKVYALDGYNMTMNYVFTFAPPSSLLFVLRQFDVLPRPAAVGVNFVITTLPAWGFGVYRRNFNRGNFIGAT